MEKMTARTISEAHTMRVIALSTLCFLPPTFIAVSSTRSHGYIDLEVAADALTKGFLDMGYIDISTARGYIELDVHPGLWLYFSIALPIVLVVVISYLWWDRRAVRMAEARSIDSV